MLAVVGHYIFQGIVYPLLSFFCSLGFKILSARRTDFLPRRNDWNASFELIISAIIIAISKAIASAKDVKSGIITSDVALDVVLTCSFLSLGYILGLTALAIFIRSKGWDDDDTLHRQKGVWYPNLLGFVALGIAVFVTN